MPGSDIVAVVDRDDRVIGTKRRDTLTRRDIVRVTVLWIENERGEVLLQQRGAGAATGAGLWGPAVAGTVEAHETYAENIAKEAEEELGLAGVAPKEVGKRLLLAGPDQPFGRMIMFYSARFDPAHELRVSEEDVAGVEWVAKQDLISEYEDHPERYVPSACYWRELFYAKPGLEGSAKNVV